MNAPMWTAEIPSWRRELSHLPPPARVCRPSSCCAGPSIDRKEIIFICDILLLLKFIILLLFMLRFVLSIFLTFKVTTCPHPHHIHTTSTNSEVPFPSFHDGLLPSCWVSAHLGRPWTHYFHTSPRLFDVCLRTINGLVPGFPSPQHLHCLPRHPQRAHHQGQSMRGPFGFL